MRPSGFGKSRFRAFPAELRLLTVILSLRWMVLFGPAI